ncbi:MAG: hypothetical protein IT168_28750 [Bryobacterales bacterium]|nr:hypothetical protein [Bryobacterales bacterium]
MSTRTVLVISPDVRLSAELAPLLSQNFPSFAVIEWNQYPDLRQLAETLSGRAPTYCFLDVGTNRDTALRALGVFASTSPSTQVIALLTSNNPDLILTCLRSGAAEFLLQPITIDQFQPVLSRLAQLNPSLNDNSSNARIYAVLPAKGACGASTLAVNLAMQWKRLGMRRNLLADLDPCTGVISFLLKLKWHYTFLDALTRVTSLDADLWRGLVCQTAGVDVLLSPDKPADVMQELPNPRPIVDFCREAYEVVTLDVGEPFSPWSLALSSSADQILLVSTNELPALRSAQRVLQHLDRNSVERSRVRLILNRYNTEAGLTQEAVETALHIDVSHVIPSDYEAVQKALVDGKPVAPGTPFTKSIQSLAEQLSGRAPTSAEAKSNSTSWTARLSSFLSRSS